MYPGEKQYLVFTDLTQSLPAANQTAFMQEKLKPHLTLVEQA